MASDSLELKVKLDAMHNRRELSASVDPSRHGEKGHDKSHRHYATGHGATPEAGGGGGTTTVMEWFNVSNAHIAAISRTHEKEGLGAAFELPKLMTMVEFFVLCRADEVMAARLQLSVKGASKW